MSVRARNAWVPSSLAAGIVLTLLCASPIASSVETGSSGGRHEGLARQSETPQPDAEYLILVTLDGLRWQELFAGVDSALIRDERYVDDPESLVDRFWRVSPEARREELMPFFWTVIAAEGQLYGNRALGCGVDLTNDHLFSYPGYNEILTGAADDGRIDSNDPVPNPNVTVLEWLHRRKGYRGRVAAFGSWEVFSAILNEERSGIPVNAGFETAPDPLSPRERVLNELQPLVPTPWSTVRFDAFTHGYALEHFVRERPRVLYVAYGETDDFAHDGDYRQYLTSARRTDDFVRELWATVQADPEYRGRTALLVTTDHGRGEGDEWTSHGSDVDGSRAVWIAALGPGVASLGEVRTCALTLDRFAATAAALLGEEFAEDRPIGLPIEEMLQGESARSR